MAKVSMKFDPSIMNNIFDKIGQGIETQVRPSAQAGAQILYDEVKTNVRKLGRVTGNLERSIYQVYSKDQSINGRAEYHISYNASKAPHGHLLEDGTKTEFGTTRSPAYPFMRPAFDSKQADALLAAQKRMESGVKQVISGLNK